MVLLFSLRKVGFLDLSQSRVLNFLPLVFFMFRTAHRTTRESVLASSTGPNLCHHPRVYFRIGPHPPRCPGRIQDLGCPERCRRQRHAGVPSTDSKCGRRGLVKIFCLIIMKCIGPCSHNNHVLSSCFYVVTFSQGGMSFWASAHSRVKAKRSTSLGSLSCV